MQGPGSKRWALRTLRAAQRQCIRGSHPGLSPPSGLGVATAGLRGTQALCSPKYTRDGYVQRRDQSNIVYCGLPCSSIIDGNEEDEYEAHDEF